jgi:hypothetical protein
MRSAIALSVAALAGLSAGQATPQNNYPYRIDPNSVLSSDRGSCTHPSHTHIHDANDCLQLRGASTSVPNARSSACYSPVSPA